MINPLPRRQSLTASLAKKLYSVTEEFASTAGTLVSIKLTDLLFSSSLQLTQLIEYLPQYRVLPCEAFKSLTLKRLLETVHGSRSMRNCLYSACYS